MPPCEVPSFSDTQKAVSDISAFLLRLALIGPPVLVAIIVHEIAQQHEADIAMDTAHPERLQPGLKVSVRFSPPSTEAH